MLGLFVTHLFLIKRPRVHITAQDVGGRDRDNDAHWYLKKKRGK